MILRLPKGLYRALMALMCAAVVIMDDSLAAPEVGKAELVWNGAGYDIWDAASVNWLGSTGRCVYEDGMRVEFGDAGAGYVELRGQWKPASVCVDVSEGKDYTWVGFGGIAGDGVLVKKGEGSLTVLTCQTGFEGDVYICAGTLIAGQSDALGSGRVWLEGGVLSLGYCALRNDIVMTGGELRDASLYAGNLTVRGDVTLEAGTCVGELSLESGSITGEVTVSRQLKVSGGTLSLDVAGSCAVSYSGNVIVSGQNSYTGDSVVEFGLVTTASDRAFGQSVVRLQGGGLDAGGCALDNAMEVTGAVTVSGATACTGALTLSSGQLTLLDGWGGELVLDGGTLSIGRDDWGLTVGSLSIGSGPTVLDFGDLGDCRAGNSYTLLSFGSDGALFGADNLVLKGSEVLPRYTLAIQGNALVLTVLLRDPALLTWDAAMDTWGVQDAGDSWASEEGRLGFMDGDAVVFDCSDEVNLVGEVRPAAVLVEGAADVLWRGDGSVAGEGYLVKSGEGTLVVQTANSYTGGSILQGGVLRVEHVQALGSGDVSLQGGTLDLHGLAVTNAILATGGMIAGAGSYAGFLTVQGDTGLEGDLRAQGLEVMAGSLSGGCVMDTAVVASGGCICSVLGGGSSLLVREGAVSLTGANPYTGGTQVESGCLMLGHAEALGAGEVRLRGGELDMAGYAVENTVLVEDGTLMGAEAFAGNLVVNDRLALAGVTRAGCVEMKGVLLTGGSLWDSRVEAASGTIVSVLAGRSSLEVTGSVRLSGTNSYTGGTLVRSGELVVGHARSLGTGTVMLTGGGLDLGGWEVTNEIVASGGSLRGASAYGGVLRVEGEVILSDELRADRLELRSGKLSGGSVCDTVLEARGGMLSSFLTGSSSVCVYDDVTLSGSNDYTGGTVVLAGELSIDAFDALGSGGVVLHGGVLNLADMAVSNAVRAEGGTVTGAALYRGEMEVDGDVTLVGGLLAESLHLAGGVLRGGVISHTEVTASGGTLASSLADGCSLTVTGDVLLSGANMHTSGTSVLAGTLKAGSLSCLGTGAVLLSGGGLQLNDLAVSNDVLVTGQALIGGAGSASGMLEVTVGANLTLSGDWAGELLLDGGRVNLRDNAFATSVGILRTGDHATEVDFGDLSGLTAGDTCCLMKMQDSAVDVSLIDVLGTEELPGYMLEICDGELRLTVDDRGDVRLVWNPAGEVWGVGSSGDAWQIGASSGEFRQGNEVMFDQSDTVMLSGVLKPAVVLVTGDADVVLTGDGSLAGTGRLVMESSGCLTLKTANSFSGGMLVQRGCVLAGCDGAFGTGEIQLEGGTLDFAGFEAANRLVVSGETCLQGTAAFAGQVVLEGGSLEGDVLELRQNLEAHSGSLSNELTGSGAVIKSTDGAVVLSGINTYSGGTRVLEGTLTVTDVMALGSGEVSVGGAESRSSASAVLDLQDLPVQNSVTLRQGAVLRNGNHASRICVERGADVTLESYTLERTSTLTVGGDNTVRGSLTFAGGTVKLTGSGLVLTEACTVAGDSPTILDLSAVAAEYNMGGSHTLMVFEGGLAGMDDESFTLRGLDETFAKTLVYDEETHSLVLIGDVDQPLPPALDPDYSAIDVSCLHANYRRVYECLTRVADDSQAAEALAALAGEVTAETDVEEVKQMLDQLGGFSLTALMRSRIQENLAHVRRLRNGMGSGAPLGDREQRLGSYAAAFGMMEQADGSAALPGYSNSVFGMLLGMEYRVSDALLLGAALEERWSELSPDQQLSTNSSSTSVDVYALVRGRSWESRSSLGFSFHSTDSSRMVMETEMTADGISGFSVNVSQEVSRLMPLGEHSFWQPYAAIDAGFYRIGAFCESGVGPAALSVDGQEAWAVDLTLGGRFQCRFAALSGKEEATWSAFGGVMLSAGDAGGDLQMRFDGAPNHAFNLDNDDESHCGLTLGMGLTVPTGRQSEFFVECSALIRESSRYADCRIGVRKCF